jgi:arsenate reductase (thioredoxin)
MRVLFLCATNACRSQMAEGWARALHPGRLEPHSAGASPGALDPRAVRVMAEAGVDISHQRSKPIAAVLDLPFDCVVTVCAEGEAVCPFFPRPVPTLHAAFPDPPALARDARSEEEALGFYREVRDAIRAFVAGLPDQIRSSSARAE